MSLQTTYNQYNITISLSRAVSEINGDFRRKLSIFPIPVYFAPPPKGLPWKCYRRMGQKKTRMMGATRMLKTFQEQFNRLDTIPECDRRTDRRTRCRSKDRCSMLCVARVKIEHHTIVSHHLLKLKGSKQSRSVHHYLSYKILLRHQKFSYCRLMSEKIGRFSKNRYNRGGGERKVQQCMKKC